MGLRPLLGPPCIPPEAPRWGFPASDILRGLRGFCSGSFLASLGDLPARRAMPACAFALSERPGGVNPQGQKPPSEDRLKAQKFRLTSFLNKRASYIQPDVSCPLSQRGGACWHCAARREIVERSEEAPEAEAAQPSENAGIWKTLKGYSVGVGIYDKPSGVVRGECRGGLGGAAAPNRPPSAPAGGGPSNRKRKAPVPAGRNTALSKDKLCSFFQRIPPAQAHPSAARRRRPKQQIKKASVPAGHTNRLSKDRLFRAPAAHASYAPAPTAHAPSPAAHRL